MWNPFRPKSVWVVHNPQRRATWCSKSDCPKLGRKKTYDMVLSDQEQNTDIMEPNPTVDMGATVEEEDAENMNTFMGGYSSGMGSDMGDRSGFTNYEGFEDNTEPLPEPEPKNNSMSMNNLLSLDLLLKSILFGLLFYLVAHPDVCNMMKKVFGKLKGEPLRLACMALFVVCYYVINLLI